MSSILDQACSVGVESTYGSPQLSTVRSFEIKSDTFARDVEYIQSVGLRRDMQTIRSDRDDTVSLGATGSLELDVQNKGLGMLLQHFLGAVSGPTQQGATVARPFRTGVEGERVPLRAAEVLRFEFLYRAFFI